MADTDVGRKAKRHNDLGENVPCTIVEYQAGKDGGDHRCFGGTTQAEENAGQGITFSGWLQVGKGAGQVTIGRS